MNQNDFNTIPSTVEAKSARVQQPTATESSDKNASAIIDSTQQSVDKSEITLDNIKVQQTEFLLFDFQQQQIDINF